MIFFFKNVYSPPPFPQWIIPATLLGLDEYGSCQDPVSILKESQTRTLGCFDEGVDDDDDGLVGDPESFRTFLSFKGGESGPFSTLAGELAS